MYGTEYLRNCIFESEEDKHHIRTEHMDTLEQDRTRVWATLPLPHSI